MLLNKITIFACSAFFFYFAFVNAYPNSLRAQIGSQQDINADEFTVEGIDPYQRADCRCTDGECVNGICTCPPGFGNYSSTRCWECKCGVNVECYFKKSTSFGSKVCLCPPGYNDNGRRCVECKCEGGICENEGGKYVCKCPPGFGNQGESKCKDCRCGPDSNCTFTDLGLFKGYKKDCICKPGYADKNGKCVAVPCSLEPCKNGGNCTENGENFTCDCVDPYKGPTCEITAPCSLKPCKNGGNCTENGESFNCECVHPFKGPTCEITCKCRGGECVVENGRIGCKCPPGYGNFTNLSCRACDCGPETSCIWEARFGGNKICLCNSGYSTKKGKCEACECGPDSECEWISEGWLKPEKKVCHCKPGYYEKNGKCVDQLDIGNS